MTGKYLLKLLSGVMILSLQSMMPLIGMEQADRSLEDRFINAAHKDNLQEIQACLDSGIALNTVFNDTHTALSIACRKGCFNVANFLLQQKEIQVNELCGQLKSLTPLQWIFWSGYRGRAPFTWEQKLILTKLLVQHGANVTVKNEDNETPLHRALQEKGCPLALIECLVDAGASMGSNQFGKTPLEISQDMLLPEHARILLKSSKITKPLMERSLETSLKNYSWDLKLLLFDDAPECAQNLSVHAKEQLDILQKEAFYASKAVKMPCKKLMPLYEKIKNMINEWNSLETTVRSRDYDFIGTRIKQACFQKLDEKFELLTKRKELHTGFCRYYKVRFQLERAQKPFWLPKDLIQIIAYYSTFPSLEDGKQAPLKVGPAIMKS